MGLSQSVPIKRLFEATGEIIKPTKCSRWFVGIRHGAIDMLSPNQILPLDMLPTTVLIRIMIG